MMKITFLTIGMKKKWRLHTKSLCEFCFLTHTCICIYIHTTHSVPALRQDGPDNNVHAEGSQNKEKEEDSSDDSFVHAVSKNVMPIPKERKEFLEDFEGFSVQ